MKKIVSMSAALLMMAVMLFSVSAFAAEETETPAEEKAASVISIKNDTGKEISYFCISEKSEKELDKEQVTAAQEALIAQKFLDDVADGSFGPKTQAAVTKFREENGLSAEAVLDDEVMALLVKDYDNGNLLEDEKVIKPEEAFEISYEIPETAEPDAKYIAVIRFAGEDEEKLVLHELPVDVKELTIRTEEEIPYIEYTANDGTAVSTLEAEKALLAPAPVVNDYSDTYYDDYSDDYYYDYSADYGYQDVYVEPVTELAPQGADGCIDTDQAITY